MVDVGLLVLRVSVGSFMFVHGSQKSLGWFGGKGVGGAVTTVDRKGLRPSWFWGPAAALAMTGGAIGMLLGLLDPLGPLFTAASMLAVIAIDRHKGFFAHKGGLEHAYLYFFASVALAITGPGAISVDRLLGLAVPVPVVAAAVAACGLGLIAMAASRIR